MVVSTEGTGVSVSVHTSSFMKLLNFIVIELAAVSHPAEIFSATGVKGSSTGKINWQPRKTNSRTIGRIASGVRKTNQSTIARALVKGARPEARAPEG